MLFCYTSRPAPYPDIIKVASGKRWEQIYRPTVRHYAKKGYNWKFQSDTSSQSSDNLMEESVKWF